MLFLYLKLISLYKVEETIMTELVHFVDDFECLLVRNNSDFLRRYNDFDLRKLLINPLRKNSSIEKLKKDGIIPNELSTEEFKTLLDILSRFKKSKSVSLCRNRAVLNGDVSAMEKRKYYNTYEYRKKIGYAGKHVKEESRLSKNYTNGKKNRVNLLKELKIETLKRYGDKHGSHIKDFTDEELEFHVNGNTLDSNGNVISTIDNYTPFSMFYQVDDNLKDMLDWKKGHYETGENGESVFIAA